jgi:lipid-binding SYLF domain-containing protein
MFKFMHGALLAGVSSLVLAAPVWAAGEIETEAAYAQALENFRSQPATAEFFEKAYAYAVFPTIGKGGIGIGGAYGKGRAYKGGVHVGNVEMGQVSLGFQLGGQAYSEIIFFENADIFNAFTSGDFELSADASAVALTLGAQAQAGTKGATASAGTSAEDTKDSAAKWYRGMAIFTIAKGGLMFQAAVGGQGFDYEPVGN